VLLGSGVAGVDALTLGRQLLAEAGGIHALLADPHTTTRMPGIGPAKRARVIAALELARRSLNEQLRTGAALRSPRDSGDFLRAKLRHLPYEVFACLYLDNRHRVLAYEELFRGTIDGASVHPREVVRRCLAHNAAAVIFAHNHPSGVAEPSQADREITRHLRQSLDMIEVRVLDHFVIGSGAALSLAERGWL